VSKIELVVSIPALNEADRLPPFLDALVEGARTVHSPGTELIVVDDGSSADQTRRMRSAVESAARKLAAVNQKHRLSYLVLPRNGGKGQAIRAGWAPAAVPARWLGFVDADGAVSGNEFWRLARMLTETDHDVLAGSRVPIAGRFVHRNRLRSLLAATFRRMVGWLFGMRFYDTQCGVKFFRADILRPLLPELHERSWLLDIELLATLNMRGARLFEEPIQWSDPGGSKLRPLRDSIRMFLGLLRLRRRMAQLARQLDNEKQLLNHSSEGSWPAAGQ
jgi:glycosyltransferase involved in cell wall biosynthesis